MNKESLRGLPEHLKWRYFWICIISSAFILISLWIVLDSGSPETSVSTEIKERAQDSQEYWQKQLKQQP